jgi:predicted metal-dependent phosphoesterase TrpH
MNADLHCHSVVSDGTLTPEALAERAKANGVELWALTDHDEVSGQDRALAAARAHGLPYLTGTEISVTFAHQTVHIVGLGFDARNTQLTDGLRRKCPMGWPKSASCMATKAHSNTLATPN